MFFYVHVFYFFTGYSTHASFVLEEKMAKHPENVKKFFINLIPKLQRLWKKEKQKMLELKSIEAEKLGFEYNGKIEHEDFA